MKYFQLIIGISWSFCFGAVPFPGEYQDGLQDYNDFQNILLSEDLDSHAVVLPADLNNGFPDDLMNDEVYEDDLDSHAVVLPADLNNGFQDDLMNDEVYEDDLDNLFPLPVAEVESLEDDIYESQDDIDESENNVDELLKFLNSDAGALELYYSNYDDNSEPMNDEGLEQILKMLDYDVQSKDYEFAENSDKQIPEDNTNLADIQETYKVMTSLDDKDNDIDYFNLGLVVDSIPAEGIEGMEGIEGDLLNYNDIDNEIDQVLEIDYTLYIDTEEEIDIQQDALGLQEEKTVFYENIGEHFQIIMISLYLGMFMGIMLIVFGVCILVSKFYEISKSVWISRHQTHQPGCPQAKAKNVRLSGIIKTYARVPVEIRNMKPSNVAYQELYNAV